MRKQVGVTALSVSVCNSVLIGGLLTGLSTGLIPAPWDLFAFVLGYFVCPIGGGLLVVRLAVAEIRSGHSKTSPLVAVFLLVLAVAVVLGGLTSGEL